MTFLHKQQPEVDEMRKIIVLISICVFSIGIMSCGSPQLAQPKVTESESKKTVKKPETVEERLHDHEKRLMLLEQAYVDLLKKSAGVGK